MEDGEAARCEACGEAAVVVDAAEGFAVCEACGFLPPDSSDGLLVAAQAQFGDEPLGVFVGEDGSGGAAAGGAAGSDGRQLHHLYRPEMHRASLAAKCLGFSEALGLPKQVGSEAKGYVLRLLGSHPCRGHWVECVAACCVYLAARVNRVGCTLVDVAGVLPQRLSLVGAQFRAVVAELGVNVPPLDSTALLFKCVAGLEGGLGAGEQRLGQRHLRTHPLTTTAQRLLEWSKQTGLYDGRRPMNMVAACVMAAARVLGLELSAEAVCCRICAAPHQSRARCSELCAKLLQVGAAWSLFPPESSEGGDNGPEAKPAPRCGKAPVSSEKARRLSLVVRHLDMLIDGEGRKSGVRPTAAARTAQPAGGRSAGSKRKLLPCMSEAVTALLAEDGTGAAKKRAADRSQPVAAGGTPPSRAAIDAARSKRQERIQRAKVRMAGGLSRLGLLSGRPNVPRGEKRGVAVSGSLDWEDEVIEGMLLAGHPEEAILEGWYTAQGAAIPESLCPGSENATADQPICDSEISGYLLAGEQLECRQVLADADVLSMG